MLTIQSTPSYPVPLYTDTPSYPIAFCQDEVGLQGYPIDTQSPISDTYLAGNHTLVSDTWPGVERVERQTIGFYRVWGPHCYFNQANSNAL